MQTQQKNTSTQEIGRDSDDFRFQAQPDAGRLEAAEAKNARLLDDLSLAMRQMFQEPGVDPV